MATVQKSQYRWRNYRPSKSIWFWSCLGCVIATIYVGFAWGGWVTGGTAEKMAADFATLARAKLAAASCVNNFAQRADAEKQLAALKGMPNDYDRRNMIRDGGWAKIPGINEPISGAAELCAKNLSVMVLPLTKKSAGTQG